MLSPTASAARTFGVKSIGIDDPGMLAFARLLNGVCADAVPITKG